MSLQDKFPEISKLWHPDKNGVLTPFDVTPGSEKKVWWLCPNTCEFGCLHEYEKTIIDKKNGVGCPFCSPNPTKNCFHQSLEYKFPDIAKLWHPNKNGSMKPSQVTTGSNKKIWWLCPNTCAFGCIHEYEQTIVSKCNKSPDCPYCNKSKFCIHQSFGYMYPDKVICWHPTKNEDMKPTDISPGSHKKVWWLCPKTCQFGCLHEYEQSILNKKNDVGCPFCSPNPTKICFHQSLEYISPGIAKQWHPIKNGELKASDVAPGSGKKVWWLCPKICKYGCLHEYEQTILAKKYGNGCPFCSPTPTKICFHQSLEFLFPEIAKQWHPTKNGELYPSNITSGSSHKVWWVCPNKCKFGCKHEYQQEVQMKTKDYGCPYCCKPAQKLCYHQTLDFVFPEISKQWHPTKNDILEPFDFSPKSHAKVWWLCPNTCEFGCLHEYEQEIFNKTSDVGCPFCSIIPVKICMHQSLAYKFPQIAKELHPVKNDNITVDQLSYGSNKRIWWLCSNDKTHEWITSINSRTNGKNGCPYCKHKTEKKLFEWLVINFPKLDISIQAKFDWCIWEPTNRKCRYDFLIAEYNLLIELDGEQHFKQIANWGSVEATHEKDLFKIKKASENNYTLIRIYQPDVYYDRNEWDEKLKKCIKQYTDPECIFICAGKEYDSFKINTK